MAGSHKLPPNSVGWHILEGYPWWPVFICDAFKLRANLHQLGSGHRQVQRKAREYPNDYALVYFFGSHNFGLVRLTKGKVLQPWDCEEKHLFLKGVPSHLVKKKAQLDDLKFAIEEAEDFLSTPEDIRLPPFMVPSDLDPSIEPPPPIERDEEMDEDEDEDEDEGGEEDGDGRAGSDQEDEDMSGGGSEDDGRKNKKKKDKKDKKDKKSSSKDKKKSSSSKSKKESSSSSHSKEKKSTKKDSNNDDKKRKKPASDAAGEGGASSSSSAPTKVAKKAKTADVKSESSTASEKQHEKKASKAKVEKKAAGAGENATADSLSGDALSAVLEKEIKWILANCQFEEMTTKTVRKLLEKRLQMDLRHHKTSIKESVARVIAAMEDGMDAAAGDEELLPVVKEEAAPEQKEEQAPSVAAAVAAPVATTDDNAANEVVANGEPSSAAAKEPHTDESEPVAESSEEQEVKQESEPSAAQRLADAERTLGVASNDDTAIVAALSALQQQVPSVEREALCSSALLSRLVALRAHEEKAVASAVASLAMQWGVEDLVPAPQPIREEDILAMKEKLENAETSHEDVLACLSQLATMRLEISHMKNTGIARVVANLRQHANDKVSIAAANLRKSWIQMTKSKPESKSDADRVKSLVAMNHILEQKDSGEGENSHLAVLEKLQSTTLSTQDIIDSKIGVVVSKLRKSSNEKVAKAATQLRKKWKTEAAA